MTVQQTPTRPAYRPFITQVVGKRYISANFLRVTFACDEFDNVGLTGRDQRIKLVIPDADNPIGDFGQSDPACIEGGNWYANWRELPSVERGSMRTYTIRYPNQQKCTIDVDFVLHGDGGPASAWVQNAKMGDELVIVAPDERSEHSASGSDWHPGTARRILLAGDETAAPAIAGILERLGPEFNVDAFIEIPDASDAFDIDTRAAASIHWIPRKDADHSELLIDAVREWALASQDVLAGAASPVQQELESVDVDSELLWESPSDSEGEFYAWIAGESFGVKTIRRLLVREHGVDRKRVAFMGYWRHGLAERQS